MKRIHTPKYQRAISLLEVLLSLSIIAIILVMATRYFFVASHNNKVNTTFGQIGGLIAATHNYKGANALYDEGTDIRTLARAGQLSNFPGFNGKESLNTMWGGTIALQTNPSVATLTIVFPDIATCETVRRAFPEDTNNNITSRCDGRSFSYTFP